jgi:guanine deaminase
MAPPSARNRRRSEKTAFRETARWLLEVADAQDALSLPPFAAAVVRVIDGSIVSSAVNNVAGTLDLTAHAEMLALRAASVSARGEALEDCALISSSFPCVMCLGAAKWTAIGHVYYVRELAYADQRGFPDSALFAELGAIGAASESEWVSAISLE